jgi:hypothetical protein
MVINIIAFLVITAILGLSITKIIMEKRKGVTCIGWPQSEMNSKSENSKRCGCKDLKIHS